MSLIVENISKRFGNNLVFKDVSFQVDRGEILCIKGKSGEGKTTLLRCLNDLEKIDSGRITINNVDNRQENRDRTGIGLVFQNYNLFPHKTVMENIVLAPLYLKQGGEDEIYSRAREFIYDLGLQGKEDFYPYQLSGGQKQRVAIARACVLNPSILCFDEPTSALDIETTGQISKIIKDLAKRGIGIIVVSHDNQFIDDIAHRTIILSNGHMSEEVNNSFE